MAKVKKKGPKKGTAKKKWFPIVAPKMFNNLTIGETYIYDAREGIGKNLTVNLMTLTKNPKTQGINVSFVVSGQHDGKLTTEFTGYRMMPSVVRRMVRRGKNKIEDSFICSTSDGRKIRLKPLVITRTKAKGSVLTSLRKALKQHIVRTAAKTSYDKISEEIVGNKFQRGTYEALSKLFPVVKCEMRWFKLLAVEKPAEEKK
jgi:ribosomal protein S3AE